MAGSSHWPLWFQPLFIHSACFPLRTSFCVCMLNDSSERWSHLQMLITRLYLAVFTMGWCLSPLCFVWSFHMGLRAQWEVGDLEQMNFLSHITMTQLQRNISRTVKVFCGPSWNNHYPECSFLVLTIKLVFEDQVGNSLSPKYYSKVFGGSTPLELSWLKGRPWPRPLNHSTWALHTCWGRLWGLSEAGPGKEVALWTQWFSKRKILLPQVTSGTVWTHSGCQS